MRKDLNEPASKKTDEFELPLPQHVLTKGGIRFDPRQALWTYQDGLYSVYLDFSTLYLSDSFMNSFRMVLVWFAENRSPGTLMDHFRALKSFSARIRTPGGAPLGMISAVDVLECCDTESFRTRNLFSLLRRWCALGISGVDEDVLYVLNKKKLRRRELGKAVLTYDPELGPFTAIEQEGIQDALIDAHANGLLNEEAHVLTWLFIALGTRPIQIAAMKVCDVVRSVADDGSESYLVYVPRAKQQNPLIRQEVKPRALINQLGSLIYRFAMRIKSEFVNVLADSKQAPLFPIHKSLRAEISEEANEWSKFHRTSGGISKLLVRSLEKLSVRSERTGSDINLCPIRFRRTMGTNMAREGHGVHVIAELLDHSRTDTASVYVAATPELATRIDKATALHMAPLAQAFKGKLVDHEHQADRGSDSSSRIIDLRIDQTARPMGSCGSYSFCGLHAPLACYTCQCFQPWLDGPHEAVLEFLLEDKKRFVDGRIASINDRTLLAVAQVVQLCRKRRVQIDA
ncbi:site-specific integrase [Pseudomonas mosselii]|uniref:site-specific integrase n=1 Tax=Pseudomonas mosselii TaxID=78327 RepID=UPI0027DC22C6|nr:site-specific integrase [Pseudomonas mosselii]